jgi:hypothetical protein
MNFWPKRQKFNHPLPRTSSLLMLTPHQAMKICQIPIHGGWRKGSLKFVGLLLVKWSCTLKKNMAKWLWNKSFNRVRHLKVIIRVIYVFFAFPNP